MGPKKIGMVVLIALLVFHLACTKLEEPFSNNIEDVIKISRLDSADLRADGAATTELMAEIPEDASETLVTFKTTKGTFVSTKDADTITVRAEDGKAYATLKVGITPGKVYISASIKDFTNTTDFDLLRAHADDIVGETSSAIVKLDGSIKAVLSAILSRQSGKVSEGTEVEFTATQLNDQDEIIFVGRFSGLDGTRTDQKGKASVTFAADSGNVSPGKPVNITMATQKDDGSELTFVLTLFAIE